MELANRTVLVTGGARGIGRELTRGLVAEGAEVIVAGRDRDLLERVAAEHPGKVYAWPVDLARSREVDALIRDLPAWRPNLSIVINNAGTQAQTDFLRDDADAIRPILRDELAVNLEAVVTISTGLLAHLRRQPSSAIVNITSGLALAPKKAAPTYCAAKAAVRTFSKALRYQCEDGAPNVRVVDAVMPLVDTDMTRGRGSGKIGPDRAALELIAGLRRDRSEIYVGKAKLLRAIMRLAPGLGERLLRGG
ncbi:SDR family oxidoreductase [Phenylobacterium sp.]|uniref:SDR family oxidoreductase n=1 Tax=Phenylobacterium sp. TaxID=1871053 RepID=UPI002737BB30|nr:SDR family NAD(P)-dependent oxidoreductase [Phenylobacterium sp.]MDP3867569.1 SDR family NAD(P)-dependent oxidoreductase [Phenylobacterium sp.]